MRTVGKKTRKWIAFRKKFLAARINYAGYWVCALCGIWTQTPEVDHIKKRSTHPMLIFAVDNLRILCPDCHRRRHS